MELDIIVLLSLILIAGIGLGSFALWFFNKIRFGGFRTIASDIIKKAEYDAESIKKAAHIVLKQKQIDQQKELEDLWQIERRKIFREEERLKQREDKLEARMNLVEKKLADIEKREAMLTARREQLDQEKKGTVDLQTRLRQELEHASGLSFSEAKELLISRVQDEIKNETANFIRRSKKGS